MTNYSIKKLQREYLKAQLAAQSEGERCPACWMSLCDCNVESVQENPFLNLSEEYVSVHKEVQFA